MNTTLTQPKTPTLLCINLLSTILFGIFFSSLELFLSSKTHLPQATITGVMGVFLALNYGFNALGGLIGGRWVSYRSLFLMSTLLQLLCCALLMTHLVSKDIFEILGLFVVSLGVSTPCIRMLLTQFFQDDPQAREAVFLWNYAAVNIGFTLSFCLAGYFQNSSNYHIMFLVAFIANAIALTLLLSFWRFYKDTHTPLSKLKISQTQKGLKRISALIVIGLAWAVASTLMTHEVTTRTLLIVVAVCFIAYFLYLGYQKKHKGCIAFVLMAFGSMTFWSIYQLMPTGMVFFIQHDVNRHIDGLKLSPQIFSSVNSIVVVLGGILFPILFAKVREKIKLDPPVQFPIALFLMAVGTFTLLVGLYFKPTSGMNMGWVILSYVLQSVGELMIAPIGIAMIASLAYENIQGVMMGSWMLFSGVSAAMAGGLSSFVSQHVQALSTVSASEDFYFHFFGWISLFVAVVGLLFLLGRNALRQLFIQT